MFYIILIFSFSIYSLFEITLCDEHPAYFLTAAKSVPRIGRSNKGISDFEKFFLKASKSVPRIGRRNENDQIQKESPENEMVLNKIKYPTWSDMAERYEYEPELFHNPELLYMLEQKLGDDPTIKEWDKVRLRRSIPRLRMVLEKKLLIRNTALTKKGKKLGGEEEEKLHLLGDNISGSSSDEETKTPPATPKLKSTHRALLPDRQKGDSNNVEVVAEDQKNT